MQLLLSSLVAAAGVVATTVIVVRQVTILSQYLDANVVCVCGVMVRALCCWSRV